MNIIDDKQKTVFRNERDGKVFYSIGISHKLQDGSYEKDYFPCRFKKDVDLKNQTNIKIQEAWLDFYKPKGEKKTFRYIFVNKFEMASDMDAMKQVSDFEEEPFY